jgi:CheY-like chemotaxis protein
MATMVRKEVLILDDDADIRILVRKILEGAGLVVREAGTVAQALGMVRERAPHLILLDLALAGNDSGFQFLEAKRADPTLSQSPVVVLTASKDRNSVYRAISLGANDYLAKPLNSAILLQKARKAMSLDAGFAKVEFPADRRPRVHMVIPSTIVRMSSAGFTLQAPLKVVDRDEEGKPVKADIQVRAPLLDEMSATKTVYRPQTRRPVPSPDAPGQYITEFMFYGLTDRQAEKVKKLTKKWPK